MSTTSLHGPPMASAIAPTSKPAECTNIHTRILTCMLAADDCAAYWRHADPTTPVAGRAHLAFVDRWFGLKSEQRVRDLIPDLAERFDAFPEAFALLCQLPPLPAVIRAFICHIHIQLADPVYRRFSGIFLPDLRDEGRATVDRPSIARWVDALAPGRWKPPTCVKFASNMLATAHDVGFVRGKRDPRELPPPIVPGAVVGYVLYVLRGTRFEGSLVQNPYLRSLGVNARTLPIVAPRIPGVQIAELGGLAEVTFLEPSLTAWGLRHLVEVA